MKQNLFTKWVHEKGLQTLLAALGFVILFGAFFAIVSVVWTVLDQSLWRQKFCLSAGCIEYAGKVFSGTIDIVTLFSKVGIWIAIVGGIVVALLNYINSTSATALGNHVSHSRIFYDYLTSEIGKRDRVSPSSVDIYKIYAIAFDNSRLGLMSVSEHYRSKIEGIANVIRKSNDLMKSSGKERFLFRDHQHRLIEALSAVGIKVTTQPRIDFFEIEEQIFSLLDSINHVFCADDVVARLPERNYR